MNWICDIILLIFFIRSKDYGQTFLMSYGYVEQEMNYEPKVVIWDVLLNALLWMMRHVELML